MSEAAPMITVEVVYALADEQALCSVRLPAGATAEQAIEQSGLLQRFPDISLSENKLALWYRPVKTTEVLSDGDRLMILRALIADPKEIRRRRAEEAKLSGRADRVTGGRPNPRRASQRDAGSEKPESE